MRNDIGPEGASVLAAILNKTKISNLKYAANPEARAFCQHPMTRACSLTARTHPLQSHAQWHRARGRLRARCRPQGDDDHQPQVRRWPRVFTFVSAPTDSL